MKKGRERQLFLHSERFSKQLHEIFLKIISPGNRWAKTLFFFFYQFLSPLVKNRPPVITSSTLSDVCTEHPNLQCQRVFRTGHFLSRGIQCGFRWDVRLYLVSQWLHKRWGWENVKKCTRQFQDKKCQKVNRLWHQAAEVGFIIICTGSSLTWSFTFISTYHEWSRMQINKVGDTHTHTHTEY